MPLTGTALPILFVAALTACGGDSGSADQAETIGADTGDNCPLPEEAPDATGDQDIMVETLEQLDTEETGWSAAARHHPDDDCITVTIRTGGEEIPHDELEAYRQDIEEATGLENVRVIRDDREPAQLED